MGTPQRPFKRRNEDRGTSPASPVTYSPPIAWVMPVGAGNIVLKDEAGNAVTLTSLTGFEGGICGPFSELTSFTCTRVRLGDGLPPGPPAPSGAASGATIADAGDHTDETTVEGALQEIYASLDATNGIIDLPALSFYLLTGAPLAIFADGASGVPGSTIVDAKAAGVRWNNNGTLDGIMRTFLVPPDMDITADAVVHIHASKTGATVGDAVTFAVGVYNQVVGALHDADANYGGNTGAMTGNATAKTIQDVTRTLALANLAAYPATATITIKPTDGTLGTDDLVMHHALIVYKKRLTS